MDKKQERWDLEYENELKAHILCKKNGFIRPDPNKYDCPHKFMQDEIIYNQRFKYYYEQLLSGNIQLL